MFFFPHVFEGDITARSNAFLKGFVHLNHFEHKLSNNYGSNLSAWNNTFQLTYILGVILTIIFPLTWHK